MNKRDLYKRAIEKWGFDSQVDMLVEECGELIAVINQWRRGRKTPREFLSEMADVEIMLEQIKMGIPIVSQCIFEAERTAKLKRLEERLNE
jgi:NTP pyrophosphatase (non-canonical NTP hydrolase)